MTGSAFEQASRIALDPGGSEEARSRAVGRLAALRNREASVLIELGSRLEEPDHISRAAGAALAELVGDGLVSEWDTRDLTEAATETFFS